MNGCSYKNQRMHRLNLKVVGSNKMEAHNHEGTVREVRKNLPDDTLLCDLGDLFKIFGDTTRIKILYSLFESELCVCAISEILGMEQSAISHQLKVLRDSKLVSFRREGKTIFYSLADDHVRSIIGQGYEHLTEESDDNRNDMRM